MLARKLASLDHISRGRAAWNLVTTESADAAANFGYATQPTHEARYHRAEEFYDVVTGLWDTWDDDALVCDRKEGVFFHPGRVHPLDHSGEHFKVRGPLNIPRPPQGHPVIVQAGSSEAGKELAARTTEVIFTAQASLADAQAFYRDAQSRLAKYGRGRDTLKIMSRSNIRVEEHQGKARITIREAALVAGRGPDGNDLPDTFKAGELILGALGTCLIGTVRG
ncbi:MAG TPA: LLM class flavin-dependent oxidoreductase [Polyangia bacterium]